MQNNELQPRREIRKRAYVYSGFSRPNHNILCSRLATSHDVYTVYPERNTTSGVVPKYVQDHRTLPYNTGKVLIGSCYTPPPYREESQHMLLLQRGLLEKHTERRRIAAHDLVLYVLVAIGFVVIYLTR